MNQTINNQKFYQLHFKWTVSKGRDSYGYNICTLLVDGEKKGQCNGGGYDMQGTAFAQWLQKDFQAELCILFGKDIKEIEGNKDAASYEDSGVKIKYASGKGYYGAKVYQNTKNLSVRVSLDGACGFSSIERIAEAIGLKLQWNKESNRSSNHTYYSAIYTPVQQPEEEKEDTYSDIPDNWKDR